MFASDSLAFNSRQARLHEVKPGERLWLVSRCPDDMQYYFVGVLSVCAHRVNPEENSAAREFGAYAVEAVRNESHDLRRRFRAEALLRAMQFDPHRPIKYGASIGQSLQSIRLLSRNDANVLNAVLTSGAKTKEDITDAPFGLWTKCAKEFADYFRANWLARQRRLAFLLYDAPPMLKPGAPIFIHSDKCLRLVARFVDSMFVPGHKFTADDAERIEAREWVWNEYRAQTIKPPSKGEFDRFWDTQHGVRSLFLMENIQESPQAPQFRIYGRALEWGYPTGVGYRYVMLAQSLLLMKCAGLDSGTILDAMT